MKLKSKLVTILATTSALAGLTLVANTTPVQASANTNYQIKSGRSYNSRTIISKKAKLWSTPYQKGDKYTHKTGKALKNKLMQINKVAKSNKATYYQISRRGHNYGWINAVYMVKPKTYTLPYTYTSQLYPLYAPNACESASLKMALSVKGIATKTSLKTIINRMPKAKTPNKGFTGNPYTESRPGETRTIYPAPLTKYAKTYDKKAANITGASKTKLIREVKRGNPVIFAGAWRMQGQRPYHVLALVGYKHGKFLVADPYMKKSWPSKAYWTSTKNFMSVYHSRHSRAVVVR
ncbi:C39 family peptidase [Levilactobacillus tujiorum]|uniref:C39 family peptidase n=1 Tax=Levilactobacillus tujiorum TaxID=2912243 RepID=UPI001456C395|nr:C39 family peptidase [Levilactobacillus tujiorum]NLR32831.1 hypothetical protein [Levilactobacillus tujiorum]